MIKRFSIFTKNKKNSFTLVAKLNNNMLRECVVEKYDVFNSKYNKCNRGTGDLNRLNFCSKPEKCSFPLQVKYYGNTSKLVTFEIRYNVIIM